MPDSVKVPAVTFRMPVPELLSPPEPAVRVLDALTLIVPVLLMPPVPVSVSVPPDSVIVPEVLVMVPEVVSVAPLEMLTWLEPLSVNVPDSVNVPAVTLSVPALLRPPEPAVSVLDAFAVIVPVLALLIPPEPVSVSAPPASVIVPALLLAALSERVPPLAMVNWPPLCTVSVANDSESLTVGQAVPSVLVMIAVLPAPGAPLPPG